MRQNNVMSSLRRVLHCYDTKSTSKLQRNVISFSRKHSKRFGDIVMRSDNKQQKSYRSFKIRHLSMFTIYEDVTITRHL